MTVPAVILQPQLTSVELDESQPAIYDRAIGLRLLYQDPGSGAEHYLIRYPPGLQTRRHSHSAAHTIIVLDGVMEANGQVLHPGSYAHFEARSVHHHAPAEDQPCLFVVIFHGPFDVTPVEVIGAAESRASSIERAMAKDDGATEAGAPPLSANDPPRQQHGGE